MKLKDLFETTANDYFRKLDSLKAMLNDRATSDNEKESARNLISKYEEKLKKEFPDAVRRRPQPGMVDDWLSRMAAGMADHLKTEETWLNDKNAAEHELKRRIMRRRNAIRQRMPGNVEHSELIKQLSHEVDSFWARYLPDSWKEELARRDAANWAAGERSDKKRKEKHKIYKDTNAKKGFLSHAQAMKEIGLEILNKIVPMCKGLHDAKGWQFRKDFIKLGFLFGWLNSAHTPVVRYVFSTLTQDEKAKFCDVVSRLNEVGPSRILTAAQKKDLIRKINSLPKPTDEREVAWARKRKT